MPRARPPVRLFLDSGVILQGLLSEWGAAKGILILTATARYRYTVVLAETVRAEVEGAIAAIANPAVRGDAEASYRGWLARADIESRPAPSTQEVRAYLPTILPILRHANDVPSAVAALLASPDWVLSTNNAHWISALDPVLRTRVVHPALFLRELS